MTAALATDEHPAGTTDTSTRWAAALGLVGALAQVLGGVLETVDRVPPGQPGYGLRTTAMALGYLLLLGILLAVGRAAPARGRLFLIGLVTAACGWVLSAAAQIVLQSDLDLAEKVLFPLATTATGIGMIVAGVAIIRARRWHGWRRLIPLICGLYPFAVTFPAFAAGGGPNFLVLSGWGACWLLLGLASWL